MFKQPIKTIVSRCVRAPFIGLIKAYQYIVSPSLLPRCRFTPTCSHYGIEAIQHFGVFKGLALLSWRLLRCHPFHPGGHDPVDNKRS